MKKIEKSIIDNLTKEAKASPRLRKNYDFHKFEDNIQRFLNALEPGTYVAPHRHVTPLKTEVFIILRGRIGVIFFNNKGEVTTHYILDASAGHYGIEIEPGEWHSVVSLEPDTVYYEIKDGPYVPISDKDIAPWAPGEKDIQAENYLKELISRIN